MADLFKIKRELESIIKLSNQSLENVNNEIEKNQSILIFASKYIKIQFVYLLILFITILFFSVFYVLIRWHNTRINSLNESSLKFEKYSYDRGYNDCTNKYKQFFLENPAAMHDFEIWVNNLE